MLIAMGNASGSGGGMGKKGQGFGGGLWIGGWVLGKMVLGVLGGRALLYC